MGARMVNNLRVYQVGLLAMLVLWMASDRPVAARGKRGDGETTVMQLKVGEQVVLKFPGIRSVSVDNPALLAVSRDPKLNSFVIRAAASGTTMITLTMKFGRAGGTQTGRVKVVIR